MAKDSQTGFDDMDVKEILVKLHPVTPEENERLVRGAMVKMHQGLAARDLIKFAVNGLWLSIWEILKSVLGHSGSKKR